MPFRFYQDAVLPMKIWKDFFEKFVALFYPVIQKQGPDPFIISSKYLKRDIFTNLYLPIDNKSKWSLLLINDGQDEVPLDLLKSHKKYQKAPYHLMICTIHAGDRIAEYGTSEVLDYKGRGERSDDYQEFIITELLPTLRANYPITSISDHVGIAGFSLGGLSAIDIAWNNPNIFGFAGVFSGALWWRKEKFKTEDPDADRIIHEKVMNGEYRQQRYWFQAGTKDETADRNNNGIIDSIDDTLHLINILKHKVPAGENYLKYVEIEGGQHNPETWRKVLPKFLSWIYKNECHQT